MIQEYLKAFGLIFVAEMGDKTQILAMAFATQYSIMKVLSGIGLGAFLNHGLAVLLGAFLSTQIDLEILQLIAGFAFVGFGLWTLKIEDDDEESKSKKQYGPIVTITLAFFIGELGDKTQLSAITLATSAHYPFLILLGTVSGMIATGALGIYIGKKLGDKVPELTIKFGAAMVFFIFGFQKLFSLLASSSLLYGFLFMSVTLGFYLSYKLYQHHQLGLSQFKLTSQKLYDYYQHISMHLDDICMGEAYCESCEGERCAIGHAKKVVQGSLNHIEINQNITHNYIEKPFNIEEVLHALADTLLIIQSVNDTKRIQNAHLIRKQLEIVLLHVEIDEFIDVQSYLLYFKTKHLDYGKRLQDLIIRMSK